MSQVSLTIAGKSYNVACADGEEAQVKQLAAMIDGKLADFGDNLSPSPAQNMLFAALLLADELEEAKGKSGKKASSKSSDEDSNALDELRLELHAMKAERDALAKELGRLRDATPIGPASNGDDNSTEALEDLADWLEKHAEMLESKAAGS